MRIALQKPLVRLGLPGGHAEPEHHARVPPLTKLASSCCPKRQNEDLIHERLQVLELRS